MHEVESDLNVWTCLLSVYFVTQDHTEIDIIKITSKTNTEINIEIQAWRGNVSSLRLEEGGTQNRQMKLVNWEKPWVLEIGGG